MHVYKYNPFILYIVTYVYVTSVTILLDFPVSACSFKRQQAPPTPNLSLSPKVETSWTLLDNTLDIFVEGYLDYDNFC